MHEYSLYSRIPCILVNACTLLEYKEYKEYAGDKHTCESRTCTSIPCIHVFLVFW